MDFCGINISCLKYDRLFHKEDSPKILVTVNAEAIVRAQTDIVLKRVINENLASIDGQITMWLYKLRYPFEDVEKISGSDLIYSIPEYAKKHGLKVFLLGGHKDSNEGAVNNLRAKYPELLINGYSPEYSPYPFNDKINQQIISYLKEFKPDILFVGFGMGKQEYWENDNLSLLSELGTKLIIGCGGSFEFASGKIKRAPNIVQNIGLEGLWRLFNEFKWFRIKRLFTSIKIFKCYYNYYLKKT